MIQQCDEVALKKNGDGPDPGIIVGPPRGMLEMEETLRDWVVQSFRFTDEENKTLEKKNFVLLQIYKNANVVLN